MRPFKGWFFALPFRKKSESFQTPVMENPKGLDGAKAHKLVEGCLNAVLTALKEKQLVGESSSRRFILRYLGSHLLRNILRGETAFLTTYAKLKEEWAERGESGISAGTPNIEPSVTCSVWAKELHSGKKKWFTTSDGNFTVRLRLRRPDDVKREPGIEGNVGFVVQILAGEDLVTVVATDDNAPVSEEWAVPPPSDRASKRQEQIERIAARFRDSLGEQPQTFIDVLEAHPERLTIVEGLTYWSVFLRTAREMAAVLVVIFVGYVAALIVSAPLEARAQMAKGWKELKAGFVASYERWCIGCDEPNRTVYWAFEHPEAYYTPNSVYFRSVRSRVFTLTSLPALALPTAHSDEAHVDVVADPSDRLRVRIAVAPSARLRRDNTKYYINFGDDPAIRGDMNKMIAVGPAALMEHVFPRSGQYTIKVHVATRMPESVRASDPSLSRPKLPPLESEMYVVAEVIIINLRVGT